MATESPIRMPETSGKWAPHKKGSSFAPPSTSTMAAEELKLLLKSHRFTGSGKDSAPNRSGSAPPSMEGSFLAVGNVLPSHQTYESLDIVIGNYESEEQLRAHPAYLAYYSANVNLNPRLPPPLISWEDRRRVRHIGAYGNNNSTNSSWGLASVDDSGNVSLRLSQGSLPTHKEEPEDDQAQTPLPQQQQLPTSDGSVDATSENWSGQQKVVGHDSQDDFRSSPSLVYNERSVLTNRIAEESADRDSGSSSLYNAPINNPSAVLPSTGTDIVAEQSSPPAPTSLSCDRTGSSSSRQSGINNTTSRMKSLTITTPIPIQEQQFHLNPNNFPQNKIHHHHNHHHHHQQQQGNLYQTPSGKTQVVNNPYISVDQSIHAPSKPSAEVQPVLQSSGFTPPLYASAAAYLTTATSPFYSNIQAPGFFSAPYLSGYALSPSSIPPYVSGYPTSGTVPFVVDGTAGPSISPQTPGISTGNVPPGADIHHQNMNKFYGQLGFPMQPSFVDPMYMQYPRQHFGEPYGIQGPFDPMTPRGGFIGGQVSLTDSKKVFDSNVYMDEHKIHHPRNASPGNLNTRRGPMSPNYFGNSQNVGVLMQYQTSPLQSPVLPGSPGASPGLSRGRAEMRFSPGPGRNTGIYSGWPGRRGFEGFEDPKIYNFLEELKSGKGRRFELSDITGHIVEFSSDQHGSRFIQQKLENCSVEEKASVFKEVLPHAPRLMTDVFGNYVIQKFFEYGSPDQRKELAKQLTGQILTLSLQMYGCRVIQKALEVIELDQKAQLVHELDGHVMRCVRDQNGNHVIQKCIESIPTDKIGFIISAFRGQVATLSMHPYGCRVIQRVLEHCTDEVQCQFIVDEILESARTLAQDQYGNYVTQHVLERGESEERQQIISKLSGHIVQLSQHKFASNVIEKCLEHGGPADQEIIINEIIGQDEGNDNLLTMMKDQFANYVVQKTLEICTDNQRMILLSRIRGHAHALKKYTYGKHIVARFEQVFGEENQSST